jgi:hypothetical protein
MKKPKAEKWEKRLLQKLEDNYVDRHDLTKDEESAIRDFFYNEIAPEIEIALHQQRQEIIKKIAKYKDNVIHYGYQQEDLESMRRKLQGALEATDDVIDLIKNLK